MTTKGQLSKFRVSLMASRVGENSQKNEVWTSKNIRTCKIWYRLQANLQKHLQNAKLPDKLGTDCKPTWKYQVHFAKTPAKVRYRMQNYM